MPERSARSPSARFGLAFALLLAVEPVRVVSPLAAFWTTPCILLASILIAWGAESAQFFVAQGFALAILAWLQTLPEFAVEAVFAWHQQRELLLAGLSGALRLLVGFAWPMIYVTAALFHRKRTGRPLRAIELHRDHSVEVIGLVAPLLYAVYIWWKGNIGILDAVVLTAIYVAYLFLLTKLPPQEHEGIQDLEAVPRAIVRASRHLRILAILGCFLLGGALIKFTAEPFVGSLGAIAIKFGVPTFIVVQWLAPIVSEFPELASTFYFARQDDKAPMAMMNIVSSNINQWTLLVAMLPVVLSISAGGPATLILDAEQRTELLLTVAQALVGLTFLLNMRLEWWEACVLVALYLTQALFANPGAHWAPIAYLTHHVRLWTTYVYLFWAAVSVASTLLRHRGLPAFASLRATWKEHF